MQAVGRMAYIWGWPLVYVYNQRTELTKVPEPGLLNWALPVAPMNQVTMSTGYINPAEVFIGDPNQDVVVVHRERPEAVTIVRDLNDHGLLLKRQAVNGKLTMPVLALGADHSFGVRMADDVRFVATDVTGGIICRTRVTGSWKNSVSRQLPQLSNSSIKIDGDRRTFLPNSLLMSSA